MNKVERVLAKAMNINIRGAEDEYLGNYKDPDEWLYASLSQPPIKVNEKHGSDDSLDWDVECPNCGAIVNYGKNTFMIGGRIYCSNKGCREKLLKKKDKIQNGSNS